MWQEQCLPCLEQRDCFSHLCYQLERAKLTHASRSGKGVERSPTFDEGIGALREERPRAVCVYDSEAIEQEERCIAVCNELSFITARVGKTSAGGVRCGPDPKATLTACEFTTAHRPHVHPRLGEIS